MTPAPILTQQQFYRRYGQRFGKQGSGAYTRYRGYVEKRRQPVAPTQGYAPGGVTYATPHTATPGGGGAGGTAGPGTGLTLMQQAQMLVNKALEPILAATNKSYDRQSAMTSAAIAAAAKEYQAAQAQYAPQVAGAYQAAQGAQAGTDAAAVNLLTGAGTAGANDLAARLGGLGGAEVPASAQGVGQGSAAAAYGTGSADLAKLISSGASEAAYGAKLPGLAALTGLQDTKSALADLGARRADALASITSAGPGQALSLYQNLVQRRDTLRNEEANRAQADRLARLTFGGEMTRAAASSANQGASLDERIRHDQAIEANQQASIEARNAAKADREKAQREKTHNTAVKNAGNQETKAKTALRALAFSTKPKPAKSTGGGPFGTKTPATEKLTYQQVFRQALNLPAVQVLLNRYAYKPAQVRALLDEYLKEAGFTNWPASRAYTGGRGNHPG